MSNCQQGQTGGPYNWPAQSWATHNKAPPESTRKRLLCRVLGRPGTTNSSSTCGKLAIYDSSKQHEAVERSVKNTVKRQWGS
jgi:hypothetical protein